MAPWRWTLNIPSNAITIIPTGTKRHLHLRSAHITCVCPYQVSHTLWYSIQRLLLWVSGVQSTSLQLFVCVWEWTLTCGEGKELSPHSQHGTQQAFVRGKPEDISVNNLPTIVSLVQIITATLLLHIVPTGEGKVFSPRKIRILKSKQKDHNTSLQTSMDNSALVKFIICHKKRKI